jgi:hypothetical protein
MSLKRASVESNQPHASHPQNTFATTYVTRGIKKMVRCTKQIIGMPISKVKLFLLQCSKKMLAMPHAVKMLE